MKCHKVVTSEAPFLLRDGRNHLRYSMQVRFRGDNISLLFAHQTFVQIISISGWNALTDGVVSASSADSIRHQLKTFLFQRSFIPF